MKQVRDGRTIKKIELLLEAIEAKYPSYPVLIGQSFLRGIFTGLGATIGVSIVLTLITFILAQLRVFPALERVLEQWPVEELLPGESAR
jgi:hypothetical protein